MKTLFVFALLASSFVSVNAFASPADICRASIMRYDFAHVEALEACQKANQYSAQAINVFSTIYNRYLGNEMLFALLKIDSQEEATCAIQIATRYNGHMSVGFFRKTCL